MKKLVLAIVMAFVGLGAWAQSDSLKNAVSRIEALEQLTSQQAAQISQLTSKVEEVTAQNLALKKNLNLKPTVARAKTSAPIEYRILEVQGDPVTKEVSLIMTIENIGTIETEKVFHPFEFIDENGRGYNDRSQIKSIIEGVTNQLVFSRLPMHINTPYTVKITIQGYNPDAKYIKYMSLEEQASANLHTEKVEFKNLPIKWVEEE